VSVFKRLRRPGLATEAVERSAKIARRFRSILSGRKDRIVLSSGIGLAANSSARRRKVPLRETETRRSNMSISGISSSDNQYSTAVQDAATQRRQDAQALADALKSGDLAAAQSAFASLQALQSSSASGQAQNGQSSGPAAQNSNLQPLAGALQSGDLSGAQAAFAALQKGHHGHHHRHMKAAEPTAATASSTSNPASDATAQLLGTKLNAQA
jgi:hypothetical protein